MLLAYRLEPSKYPDQAVTESLFSSQGKGFLDPAKLYLFSFLSTLVAFVHFPLARLQLSPLYN